MTEPRTTTDWEAIERDYRAGVLSVREVAKIHSLTEGAIRKKAKASGWERDLSAKVQEQVRTELVRNEVRTEDPRTEQEIVVAAAAQVVQVVREHRTKLKKMHGVAFELLEELEDQTINRDLYTELGELLRSEDDKGQDKRNDLYCKIISGAGRVDSMKKLAETMKILIGLERQAFNIQSDADDEEPGKQRGPVDLNDAARRVAFMFAGAIAKGPSHA